MVDHMPRAEVAALRREVRAAQDEYVATLGRHTTAGGLSSSETVRSRKVLKAAGRALRGRGLTADEQGNRLRRALRWLQKETGRLRRERAGAEEEAVPEVPAILADDRRLQHHVVVPGVRRSARTERIRRHRTPGTVRSSTKKRDRKPARHWSTRPGEGKKYLPKPHYTSVDEAPRHLVEIARRDKLPWVDKFIRGGCEGTLTDHIRLVADALGKDPPKYNTVRHWAHMYAAWGLVGLVDAPSPSAGRSRVIDAEVSDTIETALEGGKMADAGAVVNYLARQLPEDAEIPYHRSVRREMNRILRRNPQLWALATGGKLTYRELYRLTIGGHRWYPGGTRLAFDSTLGDRFVRRREGREWVPVRPVLSVVEDLDSRLIVTFNYSFFAVDSEIMLGVFRRAVGLSPNYPGLIQVPVPPTVWVDRGPEHRGRFEKELKLSGIDMIYGAPNDPRLTARLERGIQTLQKGVNAGRIGYAPTQEAFDPYAPDEEDAKRTLRNLKYEGYKLDFHPMQLAEIHDLEAETAAWVSAYNQAPHSSLDMDKEWLAAEAGAARAIARAYNDREDQHDAA
jgi:hypothetical protein